MSAHNLIGRWASSLATITLNAGMQAVGLLVFARTLGPSEYAIIVAVTAVSAVAAEFVGFGSGDLLIREVSRDASSHRSAFGRALRLVAISFVPVTLLATVVAALWFRSVAPFVVLLILVASEIVASRIVFLTEQIAIAHHRTHAANANRIFATTVRFGTICVAVLLVHISTASQWAPFAAISAILCALGCLAITARRFGGPDLRAPFGSDFHIGAMFTLMQVVRAIQFALDKFAVGWIAPGGTVGTFGVASRVSQLGMLPTVAVTRITYPIFFAEGVKGLPAASRYARSILVPILALGLISSAGLAAVALALPYLFGPDFAAAKPFLLIMALLPLAAGLQNLGGDTLSGADFQSRRLAAGVIGLVVTIATVAIGGFRYGVVGAVAGYMGGQLLTAALIWMMVFILQHRRAAHA